MIGDFSKHSRSTIRGWSLLVLLMLLFLAGSVTAQYTNYTLTLGQTETHCIDVSGFKGGSPDLYVNTCEKATQDVTGHTVQVASGCITFTAISVPGIDTICVDFCDDGPGALCQSVNLIIETFSAPVASVDTIYLGQTGYQCGLNFPGLTGNVINMNEFCGPDIPPVVNWSVSPNQLCLLYEGMNYGLARACIEGRDDNGGVDTIFHDVFVKRTSAQNISTEIEEGEIASVCFDPLEMPGTAGAPVDNCNVGTAASVAYDDLSGCFTIEAMEIGSHFNCFVFCDELNVCDTVELDIQVVERQSSANDDAFTVMIGEVTDLDICENDLDVENITSMRVVPFADGGIGPYAGTATVGDDNCIISYEPLPNACNLVDSLIYEVCIDTECNRAKVLITIDCGTEVDGLVVMNGFSPNGDGTNETLMIQGLEDYPEHTISVFNRWGAQVFTAQDYQNDWTATWDGVDIPDGVYYYLFDSGEGMQSSGWIFVQR